MLISFCDQHFFFKYFFKNWKKIWRGDVNSFWSTFLLQIFLQKLEKKIQGEMLIRFLIHLSPATGMNGLKRSNGLTCMQVSWYWRLISEKSLLEVVGSAEFDNSSSNISQISLYLMCYLQICQTTYQLQTKVGEESEGEMLLGFW